MDNQLNDILTNIPLLRKKVEKISFENNIDKDELLIEMLKFLNPIHITKKSKRNNHGNINY